MAEMAQAVVEMGHFKLACVGNLVFKGDQSRKLETSSGIVHMGLISI